MKEAAGEANMTVITIVLVGVVAAVGAILIPRVLKNLDYRSCCLEAGNMYISGNRCISISGGKTGYTLKGYYTSYCESSE